MWDPLEDVNKHLEHMKIDAATCVNINNTMLKLVFVANEYQ